LILLMRKRLNGLGGGYIWKGVAVSILGVALMTGTVLGWEALMAGRSAVVVLFGGLALGVGVYGGLMWALKMPELMGVVRALVGKIKRK
jgi:hypothetical protein